MERLEWKDNEGEIIDVVLIEVKIISEQDIRVVLRIDYEYFEYIRDNGRFNMNEDILVESIYDFENSEPVILELKLEPHLCEQLMQDATDSDSIEDFLIKENDELPDSVYFTDEVWSTINVFQEESEIIDDEPIEEIIDEDI